MTRISQSGEDPHKHLKEFHVVCSSMKPQGVSEDQIKLRAFPFSLEGAAKDWLYYLPSGSVNSWNGMKHIFLEKYFPISHAANIRKEIYGIRQYNGESLYEYWERFKKLCASCPHHQIREQLLIQYFYAGLLPMDRSMIDAASGGALDDKTPEEVRRLIANMAANSQQFGMRMDHAPKKVDEVSTSNLEKQISDLTSLVRQLAVGKMQTIKVYGICSGSGHATDMCPALQEDESMQHVNAVGNYGQPQHRYDPFSNTYNPGWRDHSNLSYGNQSMQNRYQQQRQVNLPPPSNQGMSLDEIVKALANNTQQFQQETRNSIQNIESPTPRGSQSVDRGRGRGKGTASGSQGTVGQSAQGSASARSSLWPNHQGSSNSRTVPKIKNHQPRCSKSTFPPFSSPPSMKRKNQLIVTQTFKPPLKNPKTTAPKSKASSTSTATPHVISPSSGKKKSSLTIKQVKPKLS
ncbi:hypothetical protein P3X46_000601 [Hevea brasiliensis]|uniref:Retrotransposon gag domain-containing protein n=1 Tax=Hevea brasiliensis TaxID=3981 RepID=A0ABQ9NCD4_HEVBR|nr:hypothetical protein P3X46_000601 [Hevea brasiliensis]